ncbi:Uma2 family endonuclease [Trichothermofontia sp.]
MKPILIAEVLSDSRQGYDRGDKFTAYRTISTFQESLLIDQYHYHVEHYQKQAENQWLLMEYRDPDASFTLQSLKVTIALGDLYEAIVF